MKLKDRLLDFLLRLYAWFFRAAPSQEMRIFLESILFVFVATGISKGLWFVMNVAGGRVLGPTTYGEYTLIVSIAGFLAIPAGFGVMGGLVRRLAEEEDEGRRKRIISTAVIYTSLTLAAITVVYVLLHQQFAALARMGPHTFLIAVSVFLVTVAASLTQLLLQGLHRQKTWAIVTITTSAAGFVGFVWLLIAGVRNILLLYVPFVLGSILFSTAVLLILHKYISPRTFDAKEFKWMFHFGAYIFLVSIATTLLGNLDRVMLNYYLGAEAVGLYQAYYFSSIMFVGVLTGIFTQVFFPTAVKLKGLRNMLRKLDKVVVAGVLGSLVLVPILVGIIIALYHYPLFWTSLILFTLATAVDVAQVLYSTLLSAQGISGVRRTTAGIFASFVLNAILNVILIPLFSLNGAVLAFILSLGLQAIYLRVALGRMGDTRQGVSR